MEEGFENIATKKFKFRELKVYSSTEWLADNQKKYRQVFDRSVSAYIYAELSFFNKWFDQDVWDVHVQLKCFDVQNNKRQLCSLEFKRQVSKYDNIVYFREGWGNKKEGLFWKKGTYYWEAFIDGEKVSTKYFYIIDNGVGPEEPYIAVKSIKLYEGKYDDVSVDDRRYMVAFSSEESRYIYAEILLHNYMDEEWHCELFAKFYNQAKELKGQVVRLAHIKQGELEIPISAGWGSNISGSWRKGLYTVELVFMDNLLAVVPFIVDEEFEEGQVPIQLPDGKQGFIHIVEEEINQTFDELILKLDGLIGLQAIKQQVRDHANYIKFLQLRKEKGFEESEEVNVHSVFTGNPGTGKTTVARLMGKLYKKIGLLSKGHVYEVDRVDLVGEYIGQTAPKVKEAIDKARGGVLFIDEAYALARSNDDSKDFGREVIEILVKEMSNGPGDLAVIVAGYPKEMKYFINSNPGLKSRFKHFFEFPDYLPQELSAIASYACSEKEVTFANDALIKLEDIIVDAYRNRDRNFGNARFVFDLVEKAKINLGLRIMGKAEPASSNLEEMKLVMAADVEPLIELAKNRGIPAIPIDEALLEISMKELDSLIGMKNIKDQINDLVHIIKFHKESNKNVLNSFYLHTVFVGNPGTGKTTIARILTRIYKALGILERGHMVETDRQGLVAGYIGQTAIKTAEKVDEAMGGVLFIDEAYALSNFNGLQGDYGNEAIQTILKKMEDNRGEFFIFVAGYPENMDHFLRSNPGLSSRFDKILRFEDYDAKELLEIALKMFADLGYKLDANSLNHMSDYLNFTYEYRDKFFGNARAVRSVVHDVIKLQNLRLSMIPKNQRKTEQMYKITMDDVAKLKMDKSDQIYSKKTIGFRS